MVRQCLQLCLRYGLNWNRVLRHGASLVAEQEARPDLKTTRMGFDVGVGAVAKALILRGVLLRGLVAALALFVWRGGACGNGAGRGDQPAAAQAFESTARRSFAAGV